MKKLLFAFALLALSVATLAPSQAAGVVFSELFYEGTVVGTVIPPATSPKEGRDNLYGVPGQRAVIGVAPGDTDYHGGMWAFHGVVWNVTPYLLDSEASVLGAAMSGDVTVTRIPSMDFKCPVQP